MEPISIQEGLERSAKEGWCTKMGCTTCGCPEMRALLYGQSWKLGEPIIRLNQLPWERAEYVVKQLANCRAVGPQSDDDWRMNHAIENGIMWLLYVIWLQFGERAHHELFPNLEGSWPGNILEKMKDHYASVQERKRVHALRQDVKKKDWLE